MKKLIHNGMRLTFIGFAVILGACGTVKLPDIDFIKLPQFREDAQNIKDFPKVSDAPENPMGIRSDAEWDAAAQDLISKGEAFQSPVSTTHTQNNELPKSEIEKLRERVQAYKKDDPVE